MESLVARLARSIQNMLAAVPVGASLELRPASDLCAMLELFIPRCLQPRYPAWQSESLDAVFVVRATKIADGRVAMLGACILMTDQALAPMALDVDVTADDSIRILRLDLGEAGGGRLGISGPPCNSAKAAGYRTSLADRAEAIAWVYSLDAGVAVPW